MTRALRLSAAAAAALAMAACATSEGGSLAIPETSLLAQIQAGQLARATAFDPAPIRPTATYVQRFVLDSPELETYLAGIVERLLAPVPAPHPDVRVFVLMENTIDARTPTGNEIYISRPILDRVQTEDQLAFILGHELAHIVLGHHQRAEATAQRQSMIEGAAEAGVLAAALAGARSSGSGSSGAVNFFATDASRNNASNVTGAAIVLSEINNTIVNPAWSQRQEREADRLGYDLMVAAGYNATAVPEMLENLFRGQEQAEARYDAISQSLSLEDVSSLVSSFGAARASGDWRGALGQLGMRAAAVGYSSWRTQRMSQFHDDPEVRGSAITEYALALHEDSVFDPPSESRESYADELASRAVADSLGVHDQAQRVTDAFAEQDYSSAISTAGGLPGGLRFAHPLAAQALVAVYQGDSARASQLARSASQSRYATPALYTLTAQSLWETGRRDEAARFFDEGASTFGTPDPFFVPEIELYMSGGDTALAQQVVAECQSRASSEVVRQRCREAGGETTENDDDLTDAIGGFFRRQ